MLTLPPGTQGTFTMVVSADHLANRFKDPMLPPVLATPVMILAMENAALEALKPFLERGESAVGSHVDVKHLAATPLGATVTATATVIEVRGRRLMFSVHATDGHQEIGSGTHERVLIDMDRYCARLAQASNHPAPKSRPT